MFDIKKVYALINKLTNQLNYEAEAGYISPSDISALAKLITAVQPYGCAENVTVNWKTGKEIEKQE